MLTIFYLLLVLFLAYFIRPFYKMMLGKPLALNDMESVVSMSSCSCLENRCGYVCQFAVKFVFLKITELIAARDV